MTNIEWLSPNDGPPDRTGDESERREPQRVIIIEDCRETHDYGPEGNLTGKYGWYLGDFYPNLYVNRDPLPPDDVTEEDITNPYIVSDGGDHIWGIECYWAPQEWEEALGLDVLREAVALQAYKMRVAYGMERLSTDN